MLYLHGVGHFHPPNTIDNDFLGSLDIGTDDAWIQERVGIVSRRTVLSLDYLRQTRNRDPRQAHEASSHSNAETGAAAARMAMARAGVTAADIKLVLSGSCSPQWSIPAEACTIAAALDIDAPCYDVASACSTFAAQLQHLWRAKTTGLPECVLLVQPENNTRVIDYSDRRTAVLWGDCSSAQVLSQSPARVGIQTVQLQSDVQGWNKVRIPVGGHFVQDGRSVQGFAIRKGTSTLLALREQCRGAVGSLHFIGHQANLLVLEGICRRAEIPASRHFCNVRAFGNTGAAGAPSVLSQHWETFAPGDELAMVVVGSGLTWGGALLRFEEVR